MNQDNNTITLYAIRKLNTAIIEGELFNNTQTYKINNVQQLTTSYNFNPNNRKSNTKQQIYALIINNDNKQLQTLSIGQYYNTIGNIQKENKYNKLIINNNYIFSQDINTLQQYIKDKTHQHIKTLETKIKQIQHFIEINNTKSNQIWALQRIQTLNTNINNTLNDYKTIINNLKKIR